MCVTQSVRGESDDSTLHSLATDAVYANVMQAFTCTCPRRMPVRCSLPPLLLLPTAAAAAAAAAAAVAVLGLRLPRESTGTGTRNTTTRQWTGICP